jgi:hypothetical protein
VPLHPKNGSHWAAFVRFARVLEHPASSDPATPPERVSDLSDVHAIYMLPDSAIDLSDFFGPIVTGG